MRRRGQEEEEAGHGALPCVVSCVGVMWWCRRAFLGFSKIGTESSGERAFVCVVFFLSDVVLGRIERGGRWKEEEEGRVLE